MKLARKYSRAVQSSNLRDDEQHHQTEVLAAMALSSCEHKLGPILYRVKYANDATSYYTLLEQWGAIVQGKAIGRNWPQHIGPTKIAALSLAYWLSDVCPTCTGRGYPVILNTPVLEDNECPTCRATGKRPLDCDKQERQYIESMVDQLEMMILRAGDAAVRKLAKEFDI